MSDINNFLRAAEVRTKELERQRLVRARREKASNRKLRNQRYYVIGELVCRYFPGLEQYQPQKTREGNASEFAELEKTLAWVSGREELLLRIEEIVSRLPPIETVTQRTYTSKASGPEGRGRRG